ncbi:YIP1 family protein [Staphylococcus pseudoxylosus]|uniref:YIP1 family protein n=1 Tax=Staphylococcus pseudoxylosus TaxID=2282419 RepID=UPI002DB694FA|nr:YIP1 family protein [Staphylococcus pseudoxylosus]MEB6171178.1 YIP1 family protein [Staphylococcus pseudoxylosus]
METSKLPLAQHFSNLRANPKWALKLLIAIVVVVLTTLISNSLTDYDTLFKDSGLSGQELEQSKAIGQISGLIGGIVGGIIGIGILFVIFLLISKIMKSDASAKSIFSATLSYTVITSVIGLIVIVIQWIAGLSPLDYSLTSLNIFDKGNSFLGVFDLQTLIGAYVFGVMLLGTNRFSKKSALIWSIVYLVIVIGFALIGASFQ